MYIKDKKVEEDKIVFECPQVFDTHRLINRARAIVDDYYTYINYETMLESFNFRKYTIEPLFEQLEIRRRLYGVRVSELLYLNCPFTIDFCKNGKIVVYFPSGIADDERVVDADKQRDNFIDRIERGIRYVSVS